MGSSQTGGSGFSPVDAYKNALSNQLNGFSNSPKNKFVVKSKTQSITEVKLILDTNYYPKPVTDAHIIVNHSKNKKSSTSITYIEDWSGESWKCRWGRHSNTHNSRDHFHYPPDAGSNTNPRAYDANYGKNVQMVKVPADFIMKRVNYLWKQTKYTYPSNYKWTNEYQSSKYQSP
jgi:hypothetical protein